MGAGVSIPAASAIAVDKGRAFGMGSLMGLDATAQALGMAIGSTFGGALYEVFSASFAFKAAAVATLCGAVAFAVLTRGYVSTPLASGVRRGIASTGAGRARATEPVPAPTSGPAPGSSGPAADGGAAGLA
jgi:MFS family permease